MICRVSVTTPSLRRQATRNVEGMVDTSYLQGRLEHNCFRGLVGYYELLVFIICFGQRLHITPGARRPTELAIYPFRAIGYPRYLTPREEEMYRRRCMTASAIIVLLIITLAEFYQPIECAYLTVRWSAR